MKGVVFTEFLAMVEDQFSFEIADRIIEASDLATDGAYTSVGTYDHTELLRLITALSGETGVAIPDLARVFGTYLFSRFHALYGQIFLKAPNPPSISSKMSSPTSTLKSASSIPTPNSRASSVKCRTIPT